ncbi:DNA primase family protein [Paraburkholderia sediminicola]|uniref:DNA primase family protein n=1 Tax=Paraburkholderia sediminicola TaxID=458836 RepID=UPI0038B73642
MTIIERNETTSQVTEAISLALQVEQPKKRAMEAPEIRYAEQTAKDRNIAAADNQFYCWTESYWKLQTDKDAQKHALVWLQQNNRQRATADTARSSVKTALLLAREMPPKPEGIIVPVSGAWFVMDEQFGWWVEEPKRAIGITHCIKLKDKPFPGFYQPDAVPADSLFGKYLSTSLPDKAVRELVQEYIGYTLSNINRQCSQFWVGSGSNGKSVLLNIVRALHEKAVAMRLDKLDGFDLTSLVGASLAICDETPKAKINQQALKSLISMGAIDVNPKHKDPFTYKPIAKWIMCGNHLPAIDDHSDGWWRRLHVIEWNVQLKGKDIIHDLDEQIIGKELHIVLDWALAGLSRLVERGYFDIPEPVQKAKQEAKYDSDAVASWIDAAGVAIDMTATTEKDGLFDSYREHCEQIGFPPCNQSKFFKRLKSYLPGYVETRVLVGTGKERHRARCVTLVMGQFDEEVKANNEPKVAEPAATNEQDVMADCPF